VALLAQNVTRGIGRKASRKATFLVPMLKDIIHSMLYNVVLPLRKWVGEGMAGLAASLRR
jgi:hypothetical protein